SGAPVPRAAPRTPRRHDGAHPAPETHRPRRARGGAGEAGPHRLRRQVVLGPLPRGRGAPAAGHDRPPRQPLARPPATAPARGRAPGGELPRGGPAPGQPPAPDPRSRFPARGLRRNVTMSTFTSKPPYPPAPADPLKHVRYTLGMVLGVD